MKRTHKQLEKEGWIRQFAGEAPLAEDAAEIYDVLGYECSFTAPKRYSLQKEQSSHFSGI